MSVDHLVVMGDIEEQGWMELARALRSRLDDDVIIEKLFCSRETIQKAKQDDFQGDLGPHNYFRGDSPQSFLPSSEIYFPSRMIGCRIGKG